MLQQTKGYSRQGLQHTRVAADKGYSRHWLQQARPTADKSYSREGLQQTRAAADNSYSGHGAAADRGCSPMSGPSSPHPRHPCHPHPLCFSSGVLFFVFGSFGVFVFVYVFLVLLFSGFWASNHEKTNRRKSCMVLCFSTEMAKGANPGGSPGLEPFLSARRKS